MKSIISLLLLFSLGLSINICQNCLGPDCKFACAGLQCQGYSFNATCANDVNCVLGGHCCSATFYNSFSL